MHIPSSMLGSSVCPVTATVAIAGVGTAAYFAFKSKEQPSIKRFAAVSAMIFAAQMLNFQVAGGTSGHLVGAALAAALLGTPFAVLSLSLVLSVQCILFGDGGLDALGANIINMALVAGGVSSLIFYLTKFVPGEKTSLNYGKLAVAAIVSVLAGCLALCIELAFSGIAFSKTFAAMMNAHLPVAGGEAIISVVLFAILAVKRNADEKSFAGFYAPLSLAVIFCLAAPLACGMPDAFESVAAKLSIPEGAASFLSPMSEYLVPGLGGGAVATIAAALAGIAAVMLLSCGKLAFKAIRK